MVILVIRGKWKCMNLIPKSTNIMAHAKDFKFLKRAQAALERDNLPVAVEHFEACQRTAKICFNLGVLGLWMKRPFNETLGHFTEALQRDKYFSLAAFYLGFLQGSVGAFEASLVGFRNCTQSINYTAVGMPFVLDREDVLYNLAALQKHPMTDPSLLDSLSIGSIGNLLLEEFQQKTNNSLKVPPFSHRKMIFNLLPKIGVEPVRLKGPEHVGFVPGETEYLCGFPDARNRQLKMNLLKRFE
jgi:hypothetical protein